MGRKEPRYCEVRGLWGECDGLSKGSCWACGDNACRECTRWLPDSYPASKGRFRRICMKCAEDDPRRFGFKGKLPRDEVYEFWERVEEDRKVTPDQELAEYRAQQLAEVMMEEG